MLWGVSGGVVRFFPCLALSPPGAALKRLVPFVMFFTLLGQYWDFRPCEKDVFSFTLVLLLRFLGKSPMG